MPRRSCSHGGALCAALTDGHRRCIERARYLEDAEANVLSENIPRPVLKWIKRPLWLATRKLTGQRLQATAHYQDLGMYGGLFEADAERVQLRLPPGFEVLPCRPGCTELEIVAFDYRAIDILEPYRELAVLAPVRFRPLGGDPLEGQFVLHLPVTTEEARWTGAENYGFPKIIADIDVRGANGSQVCTVRHGGQLVLTMQVDALPTTPGRSPLKLFAIREDAFVVSTTFALEGDFAEATSMGGVHLELGYDAIADQLREMNLRVERGRAIYAPHARAVLGIATDLGALPPAQRTSDRRAERAEERIHV